MVERRSEWEAFRCPITHREVVHVLAPPLAISIITILIIVVIVLLILGFMGRGRF
jgi:hypothetical protein